MICIVAKDFKLLICRSFHWFFAPCAENGDFHRDLRSVIRCVCWNIFSHLKLKTVFDSNGKIHIGFVHRKSKHCYWWRRRRRARECDGNICRDEKLFLSLVSYPGGLTSINNFCLLSILAWARINNLMTSDIKPFPFTCVLCSSVACISGSSNRNTNRTRI